MPPTWASYPAEKWAKALAHPGAGLRDPELRRILPELYKLFPQPGRRSHQEMPVWVKRGGAIDWHSHPEAVIIYYVFPGRPVVPLLLGDVPKGRILKPAANTAVYLPPNTPHAVAISRSESPRLSLALRWIQGAADPDAD